MLTVYTALLMLRNHRAVVSCRCNTQSASSSGARSARSPACFTLTTSSVCSLPFVRVIIAILLPLVVVAFPVPAGLGSFARTSMMS